MNLQPYGTPPTWWPPKISPLFIWATRGYRRLQLRRGLRVERIEAHGLEILQDLVQQGKGVLVVSNHAVHYDSAALYLAADRIRMPLYFMTAWQVFGMSSRFECWAMQRLGCFSVNRESTDRQAYRAATEILQKQPYPLVIFPEGDIYHTTDVVMPFRDGAAAIALAAAKRSPRPIVVLPCAIKFWYLEDPTPSLLRVLERLEERLGQRSHWQLGIGERIHRLAEAAAALKELDYLGHTCEGRVRQRLQHLMHTILERLDSRHAVSPAENRIPERVKALRQAIIAKVEAQAAQPTVDADMVQQWQHDMEDLFLVMQLYSYRGDYLEGRPSIERIAETIDKLEEDILELPLPTVHARRRVEIQFGDPLPIEVTGRRHPVADLSTCMQQQVQSLIDQINRRSAAATGNSRSHPCDQADTMQAL